MTSEETAASWESRSLSDTNLKTFIEANTGKPLPQWPPARWDFDTLTLAALYFHPSLEVARAQWGLARAAIRTAGARPNPTLGVRPEYSFNPEDSLSPWVAAFDVDVPIETAGKRRRRIQRAEQLSEAARLNLASAAWQVRTRLRTTLLTFEAAAREAQWFEREASVRSNLVTRLEQRVQAGAASAYETSTARLALQKARLNAADAVRRSREAVVACATALGIPATAVRTDLLAVDWPWPDDARVVEADLRRQALHRRADILAGLAEYRASQSALRIEIAKQYPDLHLGTGYEFDQGQNKWLFGLGVEVPLLNRNQGPIAEAEAQRAAAAARFTALQAAVIGELERSLTGYGAARARWTELTRMLAAQREQRSRLEAQVRAGAADTVELLMLDTELLAMEQSHATAELQAQQALGALEDAVQFPFPGLATVEQSARLPGRSSPSR